jgi:quercetin dioxygenase-like cupin family protein/DNA-binding XRE family transcriptional regulator
VGERLRQLREEKRISVRKLAELTEFSASFISQVENGQASPSIGSLERIAAAVGVTLGEFFAVPARAGKAGLVVRAGARDHLESGWSNAQIEALAPMSGERKLEPVLITLEPGGRSGKHPHTHTMEEFAFVLEGRVRLTLGEDGHDLEAGDAVTIPPDQARAWDNTGTGPARILVVSARVRG